MTTPLFAEIRDEIVEAGPMSLARYMALCLGHPVHGYYRTRDPLGARGDFVTAPEISQMFGELIGIWIAVTWASMGGPSDLVLTELGPGRGTLMADALRALGRAAPDFQPAVHLVETSPLLRAAQASRLGAVSPTWHDGIETLPEGPMIVVANEFFDALPFASSSVRNAAGVSVSSAFRRMAVVSRSVLPPSPIARSAHRRRSAC